MSAWPQAVWIVKKLQNNFDFNNQIYKYVENLNGLNTTVNGVNTKIINLSNELDQTKAQIDLTASVIRASKSNNNTPSSTQGFAKGTLWLVIN